MTNPLANAMPKVHPATRPMEADDPLELHGWQVPGDPALMLRLLTEEYARMGWTAERIVLLGHDPFYQAFYALRKVLGAEQFARLVHHTLHRCGRATASVTKRANQPEPQLVPIRIELPDVSDRSGGADVCPTQPAAADTGQGGVSDANQHTARDGHRRHSHGTGL